MAVKPELVIVSGATHLFDEPGALAEVARLSCAWVPALSFARKRCLTTYGLDVPLHRGNLQAQEKAAAQKRDTS
jgi:hypothetical protein